MPLFTESDVRGIGASITVADDITSLPTMITAGNPKTQKGEYHGFMTGILHLAPANMAGFEMCAARTKGCTIACLNTAGRSGFDRRIHEARIRRTKFFRNNRDAFMAQIVSEIKAIIRKADREGFKPAIRLNGTSDIPWEAVRFNYNGNRVTIFNLFPNVQFYDYTKHAYRFERALPENYDLTFSLADGNENDAEKVISLGGRVAVVFGNKAKPGARKWELPEVWNNRKVVDADKSDLRFLEPQGVYCGLRAKGQAKNDTSGFVNWV